MCGIGIEGEGNGMKNETLDQISISAKKAIKGCAYFSLAAWAFTLIAILSDSAIIASIAKLFAGFIPIYLILASIVNRNITSTDWAKKYVKITFFSGFSYLVVAALVSLIL